jgi:uncharacterized membrane protein YgcG
MTEKTISEVIMPSDEILDTDGNITTDDLLHDVELYNLYDDADAAENDAEKIFTITYPTAELVRVIDTTLQKLNGGIAKGNHLVPGDYGSGKSHIGLILHHIFEHPERAEAWFDRQDVDISVDIPRGTDFQAFQMYNLEESYDFLWEPIYHYLGAADQLSEVGDIPSVAQIRDLIDNQPTVLFIDELEPWLRMGARANHREENLAFIQNLMAAAANAETPLVTFLTLLYNDEDVRSKARRNGPHIHDLTVEDSEKLDFIVHRLIGDPNEQEQNRAVDEIAKTYADLYRENDQVEFDNYQRKREDIQRYYPFHPDMLELLLERFAEGGKGHQDARGLLEFLTYVLRDNYETVDLVLTSDVDVHGHAGFLRSIDHELIPKYESDYDRLQNDDGSFDKYIEELLNVVLLHSLTRDGEVGASKRERIIGVLREDDSANRIEQTFQQQVNGRAWHIFSINGEYAFDVEKHPGARIETRTDDITNDEAIHRVERLVREEFFADRSNVYIWRGVDNHIDIPDSTTLKTLVRLDEGDYEADFREVMSGEGPESDETYQFQNSFAVVGPKQDLTTNEGILQIARRVVAGEQLESKNEDLSNEFYDIHSDNKNTLEERVLEKYGQVYTTAEHGGSIKLAPTTIGDENGNLYNPTIDAIRPDARQVKRELLSKLEEQGEGGIQYEYLVKDFQRDAAYPTLPNEGILEDATKELCADGDIQIGNTIGERPSSPADTATIVHAKYVDIDDGGDKERSSDETGSGITVDPRGGATGSTTAGTSGGTGTTTETGTMTGSGGDSGGGGETVEIVTFPAMEPIEAENKFELEDRVERKLGEEWEIHELKVMFTGPVKENELSRVGLNDHRNLADATDVEQTLTISPDEPVDKDEVIEIIRDLTPPERASFEVRLQVAKYE